MKKILLIIICVFFTLPVCAEVLQAGVSVSEIPKEFFGSWRINGYLDRTNAPSTFKPQSADFWNLYRAGDVITLENPVTHAQASITVDAVEGNLVTFTRKVRYDNKALTDTVSIRLDKNSFKGINNLKLEQFSLVDNHLMKTETATYLIDGTKISGENVLKR